MRNPPLELLLDDADLVAVIKPAGLATIPGRAEDDAADNVLTRVGKQLKLPAGGSVDPRVRVVHRLDKDTSGVLLFAKHTAAQRHVSGQFQDNTTRRNTWRWCRAGRRPTRGRLMPRSPLTQRGTSG